MISGKIIPDALVFLLKILYNDMQHRRMSETAGITMESIHRKSHYQEVAKRLQKQMEKEKLAPGARIQSVRKLAETYAVSVKTIRNALRSLEEQGGLTRKAGKGFFVRNRELPARPLRIGINCPDPESGLIYKLLDHFIELAIQYLEDQKCVPVPLPIECFRDQDSFLKGTSSLDGLIISEAKISISKLRFLLDCRIPLVIYQATYIQDLPFSQVVPDHSTAMREFFSCISPGYYRGIVILCHDHRNGSARKDAFIRYAEEAGFSPDRIEAHDLRKRNAYSFAMKEAEHFRNKLIFSTTDLISGAVYRALLDKNMVPCRDFELLGYDNAEGLGVQQFPKPMITSIDYSRKDAVITAVKLLLAEIKKPHSFKQIIKIPTVLTVRESALNFIKQKERK